MALDFTNNRTSNRDTHLNWMTQRPIAHRGLHDKSRDIYENTLSAAQAAIDGGYNIELDLQPSMEMTPMVFHDHELDRLTDETGLTREREAAALERMSIHGTHDKIPSFETFLKLVSGKTGLVVELKGKEGLDDGFAKHVADLLTRYDGNACMMSFDHHLLRDVRKYAPRMALGLTAEGGDEAYDTHRAIAEECNVDFLSYHVKELDTKFVREFRQTGRPIISWTVRDREMMAYSNKFADQITFEGFTP